MASIVLRVRNESSDVEELATLAASLWQTVKLANIPGVRLESIKTPRSQLDPFNRGVDPALLGALVLSIAGSRGLVAVVGAIKQWLIGRRSTVTLQLGPNVIEISNLPSSDVSRMLSEVLTAAQTPASAPHLDQEAVEPDGGK